MKATYEDTFGERYVQKSELRVPHGIKYPAINPPKDSIDAASAGGGVTWLLRCFPANPMVMMMQMRVGIQ